MASGTERHSSNILEKFKITVKLKDNTLTQHEVQGYRVNIPGCPEAKLFVHQSHDENDDSWCVSEETSGFVICKGASKPACVGRARRMITEKYATYGTAVINAIKIKESGIAPEKKDETEPAADQSKQLKTAAKQKNNETQ